MTHLFTSESVSEGHPDKIADQISDALLDAFLAHDPRAHVAAETFVTTGLAVLGGEIRASREAKAAIDAQTIARETIRRIGYTKAEYQFDADSCGVINVLHEQSADIHRGVSRAKSEDQGAGDQGMMFGYASAETAAFMPMPIYLAHRLLIELAAIRKEQKVMPYLRPDAKSQVTVEYGDDSKPTRVDTIVLSTQHDEFASDAAMAKRIEKDVLTILIPRLLKKLSARERALFEGKFNLLVNPTGKFVIGGPHGDTGLTGRKIIVDTYGGKGAHGGGAFSGKDPSKVDRSAAYAARHVAKNLVAAGVAREALVQVAYAIGVARPVSLMVNTYGTARGGLTDDAIAAKVSKLFDMRPYAIINRLKLLSPIYSETAAYGHFGRTPGTKKVNGKTFETFTWEKLDYVPAIKKEFKI